MYEEWTTEVPQRDNYIALIRGRCASDSTSWNIASCREGSNFATVFTYWAVGFRLVLGYA